LDAPLESDLLRTFVAIADSGSFTRAAEHVGRTQSAVSMQMKRLEDIVGERVFRREPRGVRLTDSGAQLLGDARRILALLDRAVVSLQSDRLQGEVRIGIPNDYGATILPHVLGTFAKSNLGVEVTVRCGHSSDLDTALRKGELDLAVVWEDGRIRPDSEVLLRDPTVWVTSERHCLHEHDPIPVAMFAQDCWCRDWALRLLEAQDRPYRIAYTGDSSDGLAAAVTSGLAIAPLSRSMIPTQCRELTKADGFWSVLDSTVVLRQRARHPTAAIASMAEAIREACRHTAVRAAESAP
jgi:DNA-binding transcriptional LysR family regulator